VTDETAINQMAARLQGAGASLAASLSDILVAASRC
jgi:hypothetical protein